MSIESHQDLLGIRKVSEAAGATLKKMRDFAKPGLTTKALDEFGCTIIQAFGAKSAPKISYGFPGWTCISLNHEIAHGIPSDNVVLKTGDLINIDVSLELNGYFADNGCSFILGDDLHNLSPLVETSKRGLFQAIQNIRGGVKISDIGRIIEQEAKRSGYKVIKNLLGHGVGKSLHEAPYEIPCFYDPSNQKRFKKNSVVAVETFISTRASLAYDKGDGWTCVTPDGSYVAQHEHTILVTDSKPIILTEANKIWEC